VKKTKNERIWSEETVKVRVRGVSPEGGGKTKVERICVKGRSWDYDTSSWLLRLRAKIQAVVDDCWYAMQSESHSRLQIVRAAVSVDWVRSLLICWRGMVCVVPWGGATDDVIFIRCARSIDFPFITPPPQGIGALWWACCVCLSASISPELHVRSSSDFCAC